MTSNSKSKAPIDITASQPMDNSTASASGSTAATASIVAGSTPPKSGNKISLCWTHFSIVKGSKPKRATCNYCAKPYACEGKSNGITNMNNHIALRKCPKYNYPTPNSQTTIDCKLIKEGKPQLVAASFSLEACRKVLTKMIIVDGLPFRFVDGEGFREFVKMLQPKFVLPFRQTVARDCLKLYVEEKKKLKNVLKGQRVCLTTDTWTSIQNLNYMVLTAHFIDSDWKLHKRIINFCQVPNHKGETIGKLVEKCLQDWDIGSVFTITVDNACSNTVAIDYLKFNTSHWEGTILGHKYMHMRCCAHILNLVVSDGLELVDESVLKVRHAVRFVRSSAHRLVLFNKCVQGAKINCNKLLCLDVPTRWNSTYIMLDAAEKFELAFKRLDSNAQYKKYFADERFGKDRVILSPPNVSDWVNVRQFVKFLKVFYNATLRVSGSLYVTSNRFFNELYLIEKRLSKLAFSMDDRLSAMGLSMQKKYNKYWGLDRANILLYIAMVLDPRRKMEYVSFCLKELYDDRAKDMVDKVKGELIELFNFYASLYPSLGVPTQSQSVASIVVDDDDDEEDVDDIVLRFQKHLEDKEDLGSKSEVERYLGDSYEKSGDVFDILDWWKNNTTRYKILSQIARDVLAVPVSSVASENAFSMGGRVLDPFRSSLAPSTVEALVCTQDWLRAPSIAINLRQFMDEVEEFEKIDAELFGSGDNAGVEEDDDEE